MNFLDGEILHIDKPLGWTSFDVVKRLRSVMLRRTGLRRLKVGHAGTLDPLATGVMTVVTGRSTKLIDTLQRGVKEYVAEVTVGATTPSFDLEHPVDARYPVGHITPELAREVVGRFVGTIEQVPPSFSACKVDGRRAYKMARAGKDPGLKPKTLVIDSIEMLGYDDATDPADGSPLVRLTLRVICSKGTYIRALARDIGEALGSGAHLTALRRTRVGDVTVDRCLSIDDATAMLAECPIEMPDDFPSNPNTHKPKL